MLYDVVVQEEGMMAARFLKTLYILDVIKLNKEEWDTVKQATFQNVKIKIFPQLVSATEDTAPYELANTVSNTVDVAQSLIWRR